MLEQERKINNEMAMGGMLTKYQMAGEVGNPYDPFNQPNEYASWANQNKPIVANTLTEVKPFTPRVTADQINKRAGMNVVTPIDQVVPQLGSSANPYEMEVDTTETGAPGFFNKAGQFIQDNPGLVGQLGTAAITAGAQMNRVNRLARPRTLGDVRLSDKVVNPNLVDYSAERQAYNRMGLNAMDEAQRGFGSSAAAQAFKNKARLNTLEGTGKSYQSQENTNAQIRNAANMARQEAGMKEAMMNNEIDKYNLENVYGYDTMTTAQKNAITAMLGNTAGQTFGKQSDYKNQMEQAKILANQYDNKVYLDIVANSSLEDFKKRTPQEQEFINRRRVEKGLTPYGYGGIMKRSFRNGGTNNPGFKALPESVQENILDNMGMGGYMYPMGGRLMNEPMYAEGGIHIKPSKVGSLRKHLGVSEGEKIPMSKLADKPGDSPAIKKKKVFARNARKWKH
jgi:hypothetical protein